MGYRITKRYGHEEGLSCAFRQWRAQDTHCRFIHGYPLAFEFTFEGETLDDRNWLISFGELKQLKQWLKDAFDHKTCIAQDDPQLGTFIALDEAGLIQLHVVEDVGCEKFAEMAYKKAIKILGDKIRQGVRLTEVKVSEHGGNSATYTGPKAFMSFHRAGDYAVAQTQLLKARPNPASFVTTRLPDAPSRMSGRYHSSFLTDTGFFE